MVTRRLYETRDDLIREGIIRQQYEEKYKCVLEKLPMALRIDYVITDESRKPILGYVEVKDRSEFEKKRLPDYMISKAKITAGSQFAAITNTPFIILARFKEGLFQYRYDTAHKIVYKNTGRTIQTRDDWDVEVCAHIPWEHFIPF